MYLQFIDTSYVLRDVGFIYFIQQFLGKLSTLYEHIKLDF